MDSFRIRGGTRLSLLALFILLVVVALFRRSFTAETVPEITPIEAVPELQRYTSEFARRDEENRDLASRLRSDFESRQPPEIPVGKGMIEGAIGHVDFNPQCDQWLVSTNSREIGGSDRFYLYVADQQRLDRLDGFPVSKFSGAFQSFILSDSSCQNRVVAHCLLVSSGASFEIWRRVNGGDATKFIDGGEGCVAAPNHSALAFDRPEDGYHTIRVWMIDGGVLDVISAWEQDPGSGGSFHWQWSGDSQALRIRGASAGFHRAQWRNRYVEFDLLYLVPEKKMFSIKLAYPDLAH